MSTVYASARSLRPTIEKGNWGMKARQMTEFGRLAPDWRTLCTALLVGAALVAVIGSAQAAPSKKLYAATVRLTDATTSL